MEGSRARRSSALTRFDLTKQGMSVAQWIRQTQLAPRMRWMKASRFSPLSRDSSVQVRSEIVWWSRRYCAFSASGRDFHSGTFFVFFGFGVAASASGSASSNEAIAPWTGAGEGAGIGSAGRGFGAEQPALEPNPAATDTIIAPSAPRARRIAPPFEKESDRIIEAVEEAAALRPDQQAIALRDAMRVLFPEAVALVSAARQGFMREG